MTTVVQLVNGNRAMGIKPVKQPRGGYIPVKSLEERRLSGDSPIDLTSENIPPRLVGLAVDYLSRIRAGTNVEWAFDVSLKGARLAGEERYAQKLVAKIDRHGNGSVKAACRLVRFDDRYRAGVKVTAKDAKSVKPNKLTCKHISEMVDRFGRFLDEYGPIELSGMDFEGALPTKTIFAGEADFMTVDTLWDMKVSKNPPTNKHTLQLLLYYILGLHSWDDEWFRKVKRLGIYNPRLDCVYLVSIASLDRSMLYDVETKVAGIDERFSHWPKTESR